MAAIITFRKEREAGRESLSLTGITLIVGVIYTTLFEYKNQVIFNMAVFDGGPRFVKLTLAFSVQTKTFFLAYQKQVIFQYDAL